jgi:CRISPR-associated exonuclease Cas4
MDDYIPISYINALAYCPRRFYYEYVQAEMLINEHVVEGRLMHERSDQGDTTWRDEAVQQRRVYVWSDRLRLSGIIDVVERSGGELSPVEYKRGKLGRWRNDHAQLCAQALCLEERLGVVIARGFIFSFAQRRREEVIFDQELRDWTETLAREAHRLAQSPTVPGLIEQRVRCRECSLEPLCLPNEIRTLATWGGEHGTVP